MTKPDKLMPIRLDPQGNEPAALFDFAGSSAGQRVLEIGCGDGCLTWLNAVRCVLFDGMAGLPYNLCCCGKVDRRTQGSEDRRWTTL